jgi:hypothetical protein
MNDQLPAPPITKECDLRGYNFMPLFGEVLLGSSFHLRASDKAWRAAITLWWKAWIQHPPASLPDDDAALCRLAELGTDLKTWHKIKSDALYGFIKCSDGLLYHPFLAKHAIQAWKRRLSERTKKDNWRKKKDGKEPGQDQDNTVDGTVLEPSCPRGQTPGQNRAVPV